MNSDEFKKVEDYFHDGILDRVEQKGNNISIWMFSCILFLEWLNKAKVQADAFNHIKGILHCINVNKLVVNDIDTNTYIQKFDYAEILHVEILERGVQLLVVWYNMDIEDPTEECQEIIIEADTIYWEHANYAGEPSWNLNQKFHSQENILDIYELKKVEHLFQNGLLDRVEQKNKDIELWMTSNTVSYDWLEKNPLKVSAYSKIRGVLNCINVKQLVVDGLVTKNYIQKFDIAKIKNVEMLKGGVKLILIWSNFPQDDLTEQEEEIFIEADNIYLEHVNFVRQREWNLTWR